MGPQLEGGAGAQQPSELFTTPLGSQRLWQMHRDGALGWGLKHASGPYGFAVLQHMVLAASECLVRLRTCMPPLLSRG